MPEHDGFELIGSIKKRLPDSRILAMTVDRDQDLEIKLNEAGVNGIIYKDGTSKEFISLFGKQLDKLTGQTNMVASPTVEIQDDNFTENSHTNDESMFSYEIKSNLVNQSKQDVVNFDANYTTHALKSELIANAALAILKGQGGMQEIAEQYGISVQELRVYKQYLEKNSYRLFQQVHFRNTSAKDPEKDYLYCLIGKLTAENESLKRNI